MTAIEQGESNPDNIVAAANEAVRDWDLQHPRSQRSANLGRGLGYALLFAVVALVIYYVFTTYYPRSVLNRPPQNITDQGVIIGGPSVNYVRVDQCLHWGTECGQPAADYYCQTNGFSTARSFQTEQVSPTWVQGNNMKCDAPSCVGFREIVCNR
jgi:hypothetical protein